MPETWPMTADCCGLIAQNSDQSWTLENVPGPCGQHGSRRFSRTATKTSGAEIRTVIPFQLREFNLGEVEHLFRRDHSSLETGRFSRYKVTGGDGVETPTPAPSGNRSLRTDLIPKNTCLLTNGHPPESLPIPQPGTCCWGWHPSWRSCP